MESNHLTPPWVPPNTCIHAQKHTPPPLPPALWDLQTAAWFEELRALQNALMLGLVVWLTGFLELNELSELW